jgi:WD40 repeat protein
MQRRCRWLLAPALMMLTSCDHHPIAPVVSTPSNAANAALPGASRSSYPGGQRTPFRPELEDLAAVPPGDGSTPLRAVVDDYPAWSPDGRLITFHRRYPSRYGPPGLYVVPRHGGVPRLLLTGGFFFPSEVSFSPDGERLVCNNANQLVFVNLQSGAISRPMYTDNGATCPDWSPDGHSVVYYRVFLDGFPAEPPDSAGLHIFDVKTGLDRLLWSGYGAEPAGPSKWIRNGTALAMLHGDNTGWHFSVAALDGSEFNRVLSVATPEFLWNLQHLNPARPRSGPRATESVVMLVVGRPIERTLQVTIDPVAISQRQTLGLWDAVSPDGREVAVIRPDPADSLGVLYVGHADASPHAGMLQLTHFDPP